MNRLPDVKRPFPTGKNHPQVLQVEVLLDFKSLELALMYVADWLKLLCCPFEFLGAISVLIHSLL